MTFDREEAESGFVGSPFEQEIARELFAMYRERKGIGNQAVSKLINKRVNEDRVRRQDLDNWQRRKTPLRERDFQALVLWMKGPEFLHFVQEASMWIEKAQYTIRLGLALCRFHGYPNVGVSLERFGGFWRELIYNRERLVPSGDQYFVKPVTGYPFALCHFLPVIKNSGIIRERATGYVFWRSDDLCEMRLWTTIDRIEMKPLAMRVVGEKFLKVEEKCGKLIEAKPSLVLQNASSVAGVGSMDYKWYILTSLKFDKLGELEQ